VHRFARCEGAFCLCEKSFLVGFAEGPQEVSANGERGQAQPTKWTKKMLGVLTD